MIPVGRLAPANCWDQTHIEDILQGCESHAGYPTGVDGCIVVIPGRFWAEHYDAITEALARYRWVLAFRVSDEEDWFRPEKVEHPNIQWWVQTPRFPVDRYPVGSRFLPVGYTPHARNASPDEKLLNVFLSCQDTHQRRHECFNSLEGLRDSRIHRTAGFTQGMDPAEYMRCMGLAKIAPCPSGAVSVDSFRVYEALESGALPVVDTVSPVDGLTDYWVRLFTDVPFPVVTDWSAARWSDLIENWDITETNAWWQAQKRRWTLELKEDLQKLGAL